MAKVNEILTLIDSLKACEQVAVLKMAVVLWDFRIAATPWPVLSPSDQIAARGVPVVEPFC